MDNTQLFSKFDQALGKQTPTSLTPQAPKWGDQLRASETQNTSSNESPGVTAIKNTASDLATRGQNIVAGVKQGANDINASQNKTMNPMEAGTRLFTDTALNTAGQVAGGAGDIIKNAVGAVKPLSDLLSGAGDQFAKANPKVIKTFNDFVNSLSPDTKKNLGNVVNIATIAGGNEAEPAVKQGAIDTAKGIAEKGSNLVDNVKGLVSKTPQDELAQLANETAGVADKKAKISALEQTGALDKNGKPIGGTKQTLTGGIKTEPTAADLSRAKDVQGIVKVGASPVDNLTNLNKEISRISEQEVTPALEKAGATTPISDKAPGWNTTVQRLNDIEKPDIIKADSTLNKTYDLVRQRMIGAIKKEPATVKGLWDARKAFDNIVKDQFGDVAFDSEKNTAIKRAISDMRRTVNDIIGERVPEYKPQMSKLSNLYDARYNIAEQFQSLVNKGGVKAFSTLNPKTFAALKWGLTGVGYEGLKHTVAPFLPGI